MNDQYLHEKLKNFLDDDFRLKNYPAKRNMKILSLFYLASKFDRGRFYTEREINQILKNWHTFDDWAMLRRDLYDLRFFTRQPDGSSYRLEENQPTPESLGISL